MGFFRRNAGGRGDRGRALVTPDALERIANLGRARFEGNVDVWDTWPSRYTFEIKALSPDELQRYLEALLEAVTAQGGWAIYGAEDIIDGALGFDGRPESGNVTRDALFEAAIDFQRAIGVWWSALSPREQLFWRQRHPGEQWLAEREPPSRQDARITPLEVGQERKLSILSRARDSRGMLVAHRDPGRYVLELDYSDDDGNRLRDQRDEAGDLYDLYWRFGRGIPAPGVWVDPEFEAFLPYPMPRP